MSFAFAHPWALLLLAGLTGYAWWSRRERPRGVGYPRAGTAAPLTGRVSRALARAPGWLRGVALALLIIALADPRTGVSSVDVEAEGIAIVLALDISSSMLAEDFAPQNRLEVARDRVTDFIRGRQVDRIGLVAFAGEALTQVPLTIDYAILYQALTELQPGLLEDGTAIGTAIATAANRLRRVEGESRVLILMTDGENNRGAIEPLTAARAAAAFGVRIYTIGVGTDGFARTPIARGPFGYQYANVRVRIDEALLREIAEIGAGRYFRATNAEALDSIYAQIDRLERTPYDVRRYVDYTSHAFPFVLLGSLLFAGEWLLRGSRWGRVP
ncbi:MAG: VWA domain-containing protein [Longimicrobiales bacterium]